MFSYLVRLQKSICVRQMEIIMLMIYNKQITMSTKFDEELSYATHKKHTVKFKVVFIGDQSVGKSSIINRFIKDQFDSAHNPTVGIDFVSKNLMINDKSVRLQLWDTAGQERFKSLIPGYLRDSNAIFLVYDITNRESYNNVMGWIDFVKEHRGDDVVIFIIGNKIDLNDQRVVTLEEAQESLKPIGANIVEVSAKSGQQLQSLFNEVCYALLKGPGFESTSSHANGQKQKKQVPTITGQKEKPIKKKIQGQSQTGQTIPLNGKQLRGSKLLKKESGKVVREKKCC